MDNDVAINKCNNYDVNEITAIISKQLCALNIEISDFNGKNVLIKPNLLMKAAPEKATTTHPAVVEAVCGILKSAGANVIIADSCGGLYTESVLRGLYRVCGMENCGANLNFDLTYETIHNPNGQKSKFYNIITPVCKADYIFNVCKLKTHAFTTLSAAVKNLFGIIPGAQKFEMHARFKNPNDFYHMLVELCKTVCDMKPIINIVDGIIGMEGNGPSGGNPREIGCVITGKNPFAVDEICEYIVNLENQVSMINIARKFLYCPDSVKNLNIIGDGIDCYKINDFKKPDSSLNRLTKFIPNFLKPRPIINKKKCVRCGDCVRSCPEKIITINEKNNKALIDTKKCIKCYCCQELCAFKAVKVKKSFIFKIIK
ncbi:MAG: DUF362 domain-containing protein [Oscillospiraceae bacterium]|nr:DUF362 domain-containing protein [Oscillospiraceae bacterium]